MLPSDYGSEHPTTGDTAHQHHTGPIVDPSTKLLDPLVALAACASVTTQLRLATGIFILPLRHPLLTARMTLTLQDVAGGRFLLGVGSGWLEEEFDALAVPFDDRAARMDETLAILRQAWSGDVFSHDGPLFSFGNVQLSPEPVDVPLILGGNTERALRRAATAGDGWFSSGTPSFDDAVRLRDRVLELRDATGARRRVPDLRAGGEPESGRPRPLRGRGLRARAHLGRPAVARRGRPGRQASGVRRRGRRARRRTAPSDDRQVTTRRRRGPAVRHGP